jgi:CRISPR/Cas system-associated exonuclease Cas4 (RecB family)
LKELIERATDIMQEVALFKDMGDFYINGRADLLISDTVIDYKTDVDIAARIKEYEVQLCLYSIALGAEKAYIYSVKDGKLLPVTLNKEALLEDIRKRINDPKERIPGEHCEECSYRGICCENGRLEFRKDGIGSE